MLVANLKAELETDVWECLDAVTDPELDEPITEMGFVERIEVTDAKKVRVEFRLPTYWCSPNFAFLMAFGIRKEVTSIPWVVEAEVQLNDHCFGEKVNEGVNSGRPYHEIFADYCDGARLDEVVDTFLAKAFDRRQETVLLGLQGLGYDAGDIVSMPLEKLQRVAFTGEEELRQLPRYLDLLLAQGLASAPDDLAFPAWDGDEIAPHELGAHLTKLRGTRINMEFNGALCRGLAKTRYKEVEIGADGPRLIDFIEGRVPPREDLAARS
ncbi:metal-sulfur cluster assembly factor [Phaeobacter gallaeciensis]|uniref:metal-sulfur cluster assembly factor n=1 Tax=Phaeobacter gallaeciensis TaxID=60890 RepID=UPI000BBBB14D|nr:iron-sulfur cluster assembly protein [Phaeobacter gallaeciensis]ATF18027.1 putative metal-sulfur cluster biosynthetic enzyme [Phaeobacter gallaeciensis]ATF22136.1 putative metal-sulfur cluster biosynthetic enzyme [Phaeobacter gallaeciensis]